MICPLQYFIRAKKEDMPKVRRDAMRSHAAMPKLSACEEENTMSAEKRDFDKEAAKWDENPARSKLADDIVRAISEQIDLTDDMDIMDFGCGTGLLALRLQPIVRSVTGVDSSKGMLDIFMRRSPNKKVDNVSTVLVDLDKGDPLRGNYDLVVSNMTLHHIKEIGPLLAQLYEVIAPGSYLCISDLDLDGGQLHRRYHPQ